MPAPSPSFTPLTLHRVFALALLLRLTSALLSRAFFQPDEYWQTLEVAHRWVWGWGGESWEWRVGDAGGNGGLGGGGWMRMAAQGGKGGIRSPLSVLPTAAVYWVLKQLGGRADEGRVLVRAPRLLQAVSAASTDVAVVRLSRRLLGPAHANAALLASLLSFFHFFTLSRTFSNSTEVALTTWALVYWPWSAFSPSPSSPSSAAPPSSADAGEPKKLLLEAGEGQSESLVLALAFAATATIIRPSNGVIWALLGAQLFARTRRRRERWRVVRCAVVVGLLASAATFALDSVFYGTPTFTPLRFLHQNVVQSISLFYGANSSHFYLTQGLPLLLLTQLPFFLHGARATLRKEGGVRSEAALRALLWTAGGTTAVYSLLSHKEWRFLHPLLPILHLLVARSLVALSLRSPSPSSASRPSRLTQGLRVRPSHLLLLFASLPPALYLTAFHGLGQTRVLLWLGEQLRLEAAAEAGSGEGGRALAGEGSSVGLLMPCHSTGWQAFLHAPGLETRQGDGSRLWQIECEPPVLGQDPSTYLDQSDFFYASPTSYLLTRFPATVDPSFPPSPPLPPTPPKGAPAFDLGWLHSWPERVVLFSNLLEVPCDEGAERACGEEEKTVGGLLSKRGYREERRFWNTLGGWHEDERRRGEVVVMRWVAGGEGEEGGTGGGQV